MSDDLPQRISAGMNVPRISPTSLVAGSAGGGAVAAGAAYYTWLTRDPLVLIIIVAGAAATALITFLYFRLRKMLERKRARPLARSIIAQTGATPRGISDPRKLADVDTIRRQFEEGIQKLQRAGKDLYSMPWYLLVGEPGSGKTEAIRRSGVGFPPGMQNEMQGAGGTLGMHWWFTNHAVILDTKGKLLFDEVAVGGTDEWVEFLRLLNKWRPNCPINGLILVIPAPSLLADEEPLVAQKAARIAQQFEVVHRTLGIRFPVFVMLTKCDKITGFREFFEALEGSQGQHQILGWSNSAPLDAPFSTSEVDKYLAQVRERLLRRRMGLMLDPVNTINPQDRRTDQVDSLYAFPDDLLTLGPSLRKYLEIIFTPNNWTEKPPFLRGIYFNSSMREGAVLDMDLAKMLAVPVESLPEGKIWEVDKPFFIRDLLLEKVFKERGLVTRTGNVGGMMKGRKIALLGVTTLAVASLGALTFISSRQLENSIRRDRDYWTYANKNVNQYQMVVPDKEVGKYDYNTAKLNVEGRPDISWGNYLAELRGQAGNRIPVPFVFGWTQVASGQQIDTWRNAAYHKLVREHALQPLVDAARKKIQEDFYHGSTYPDFAKVYAALAHIERAAAGEPPQQWADKDHGPEAEQKDVEALAAFVFQDVKGDPGMDGFRSDLGTLNLIQESGLASDAGAAATISSGTTSDPAAALQDGADGLLAQWTLPVNDRIQNIDKLLQSLKDLHDHGLTVKDLHDAIANAKDAGEIDPALKSFHDGPLKKYISDVAAVDALLPDPSKPGNSLDEQIKAAYDAVAGLSKSLDGVLPELKHSDGSTDPHKRLSAAQEKLKKDLDAQIALLKGKLDGQATLLTTLKLPSGGMQTLAGDYGNGPNKTRVYASAGAMAKLLCDYLANPRANQTISGDLGGEIASIDRIYTDQKKAIDALEDEAHNVAFYDEVIQTLDLRRQIENEGLIREKIVSLPDRDGLPAWLKGQADMALAKYQQDGTAEPFRAPSIPLTALANYEFDKRYDPQVLKAMMATSEGLNSFLKADQPDAKPNEIRGTQRDALQGLLAQREAVRDQYLQDYLRYWAEDVPSYAQLDADWTAMDYAKAFKFLNEDFNPDRTNEAFSSLGERIKTSLDAVRSDSSVKKEGLNQARGMGQTQSGNVSFQKKLGRLKALTGDVEDARWTLVQLSPNKMLSDYVEFEEIETAGYTPVDTYRWKLTSEILGKLAKDHSDQIDANQKLIRVLLSGFPLNISSKTDLTTEQLIEAVTLATLANRQSPGDPGLICNGAKLVDHKEAVNSALGVPIEELAKNPSAGLRDDERKSLNQAAEIQEFLKLRGGKVPTIDVSLVGPVQDGELRKTGSFTKYAAYQADSQVSLNWVVMAPNPRLIRTGYDDKENPIPFNLLTSSLSVASDAAIDIKFSSEADATAAARNPNRCQIHIDGSGQGAHWPILRLLCYKPDQLWNRKWESGRVVYVEVPVTGNKPNDSLNNHTVILKLELKEPATVEFPWR